MADENVTQPQAEPLHLSPVGWEAELAELRQRQALANVRRSPGNSVARIVLHVSTPVAG
jgi:hypothetical protein